MNSYEIKESRFKDLDIDSSILGTAADITNLNQLVNQLNQEQKPANNIIVLAKRDNVTHNYFHYFEMYWDSRDCLSSIIIKMPKTDVDNTKYWINYTGDIMLYMGDNNPDQQVTNDDNNKQVNTNYWDLQGAYPIFQGEVSTVKEYKNELEIHIHSIGIRFKQKIPEEFRQSYINGQNVRDAFQAICEFLGVKYICPPPTTTESTTTDGTENDAGQTAQQEQNIAAEASKVLEQAQSTLQNDSQSDSNTNDENSNTDNTLTVTDNGSIPTTMQNGYQDISFDANGSIVHAQTVMETGIDITDTLLTLEEHPLDKYLPEEEYEEGQSYLNDEKSFVVRDVNKLLSGGFFDTVHNNVMNYGAITIEPASTTTSDMSGTVGDVNGDGVVDEQDAAASGSESGMLNDTQLYSAISDIVNKYYPASKNKNGWINQLRQAPTSWSSVAEIVNKMGGDKSKQNTVVSEVLKLKRRHKTVIDRHNSDGRVSTDYINRRQQRQNQRIISAGAQAYRKASTSQKGAIKDIRNYFHI